LRLCLICRLCQIKERHELHNQLAIFVEA
jgi:hypothetical protein